MIDDEGLDRRAPELTEELRQELAAIRLGIGLIIATMASGQMPAPPPGLLEALGLTRVDAPRILRPN